MYNHVPVFANLPSFFFFFFSEVATEVPFRLMHPQPQDPGQSRSALAFSGHLLLADLLRVHCQDFLTLSLSLGWPWHPRGALAGAGRGAHL